MHQKTVCRTKTIKNQYARYQILYYFCSIDGAGLSARNLQKAVELSTGLKKPVPMRF